MNKEVIVLGAGGSAKSILYSLRKMGVEKILLINRSIEKANALQDNYVIANSMEDAEDIIKNDSIIINTTSVGMESSQSPIDLGLIHKNQVLIDIIYSPMETCILKFGRKIGAFTINGLDMLLYQAQQSFYYWLNKTPKITKKLKKILEKEIK